MPFHILPPPHRGLAVAIVVTIALTACGGGDDETAQATTPAATDAATGDQTSGAPGGQSPLSAVIECLRAEGLDVDEPEFGGPGGTGGPPGRGSLPPDFSVPEGGFPRGSIPEGGFPGGSIPEGGAPRVAPRRRPIRRKSIPRWR